MTHQTVTLKVADAIVQIPQATVVRNFLASLGHEPEANGHRIPAIGEYWPGQGGVNAGLMRGKDGPDYWLIVPTDPAADFSSIAWGSRGKEEPDACCEYDGLANTRALLESKHPHPAAEACADLSIDGHGDFYLPARRELALLYANVPELFEKEWHWSSTQGSSDVAWAQHFTNGYQGGTVKEFEARARAVRRLII